MPFITITLQTISREDYGVGFYAESTLPQTRISKMKISYTIKIKKGGNRYATP
jgi:hypothetical protein